MAGMTLMLTRFVFSDSCMALCFRLSVCQDSKLTLANSQNARDFDKVRVRKISTSKHLQVRIIHVCQTFGKNLLVVSPVC